MTLSDIVQQYVFKLDEYYKKLGKYTSDDFLKELRDELLQFEILLLYLKCEVKK